MFDSWLIEIWPLVLGYDWGYLDIQRVAAEKLGNDSAFAKQIDQIRNRKERCNRLGLEIGTSAKKNVGRPTSAEEHLMPPMYQVALQIDGLEDHADWFYGIAEAGFKVFGDLPRQS